MDRSSLTFALIPMATVQRCMFRAIVRGSLDASLGTAMIANFLRVVASGGLLLSLSSGSNGVAAAVLSRVACPDTCRAWYDGCNVCECRGGKTVHCTRKYCDRYLRPFCKLYRREEWWKGRPSIDR
jgi:hypothetical protein